MRFKSATLAAPLLLLAPVNAWAQCTDTLNAVLLKANGTTASAQEAFPFGRGSSVGGIVSTINTINTAFLTTTSAFVTAPGNAGVNQNGAGAWGRVVAGGATTKTDTVATASQGDNARAINPLGFTIAGNVNCRTTVQQDYYGFQLGYDVSKLNINGSGVNWHWGITGGQINVNTKDTTGPGSSTVLGAVQRTPASTFSEEQGIPYVGLYTTLTAGGFFIDGQIRYDLYRNSITDPNNFPGVINFDGHGVSVTGNVGYNIPLGGGWFIEPSGGAVWSRISLDTIRSPGQDNTVVGRGTLSIDDVTSLLGRASLRFGTNFQHAGVTYQPFASYSIFHEFSGDITATSQIAGTGAFNGEGLRLTTQSFGGVGTYSQFAIGTAAVLSNNTAAYIRGDYKVGDNIEGWGFSAGLRFLLDRDPPRATLK